MYESNNELRQREGVARLFRLFDAQQKEMTATMVTFTHETHALGVEDDTYGGLTIRIQDRATMGAVQRIRFPKKPFRTGLAVVYNFRKTDSLARLSVEPALLAGLEAAAIAHDAFLVQKAAEREETRSKSRR